MLACRWAPGSGLETGLVTRSRAGGGRGDAEAPGRVPRAEDVPKGPRMSKHQLKADVKASASGEGTIQGSEDQESGTVSETA